MSSSPDGPMDGAEPTIELARAARAGSPAEFGPLYERVAPAIHAWAALRLRGGARGRIEPEDVVQETWCRALVVFERFDADAGNFRAWIFSIAKHVLQELLRRVERADRDGRQALDASGRLLIEAAPAEVTSVTRRIARDDALAAFLASVEDLPEADRGLVVYCGLEGLTCEAAGERLGLSRDAAIKRWQRLRAKLTEQGGAARLLEG